MRVKDTEDKQTTQETTPFFWERSVRPDSLTDWLRILRLPSRGRYGLYCSIGGTARALPECQSAGEKKNTSSRKFTEKNHKTQKGHLSRRLISLKSEGED